MKRPGLVATLAVVSAAVIALAISALGLSDTSEVRSPEGLAKLSNVGVAVPEEAIPNSEKNVLVDLGALNIMLLREHNGVRYYRAKTAEGAHCYITGLALSEKPHFGIGGCLGADSGSDFPSPKSPILDYSVKRFTPDLTSSKVVRLAGFAADGVTRVGIVDGKGNLHTTPVIDNVYGADHIPAEEHVALVALDSTGNRLYTHPLRAPGG